VVSKLRTLAPPYALQSLKRPLSKALRPSKSTFVSQPAIQQAVLDGTVKLLKQYGVDASQFEQVANTIVNTGIMVSGGNFSASQVAAGSGASAVVNNFQSQPSNN
jgi:hypothetical protein